MEKLDAVVALVLHSFVKRIGKGDASVLTARTADGYHKLVLSLLDIVGN